MQRNGKQEYSKRKVIESRRKVDPGLEVYCCRQPLDQSIEGQQEAGQQDQWMRPRGKILTETEAQN